MDAAINLLVAMIANTPVAMIADPLFTLVAGLAVGALVGYLLAARRSASLAATLAAERASQEEKMALWDDARDRMSHQFRTLADEILEDKSRRFAEQNRANLGHLLEPLKTRLEEFQKRVDHVYVEESKDRSALAQQVTSLLEMNQRLADEAKDLTRALKGSTRQQGAWGEMVLERILEAAGLRRGHEYTVQHSITRDDATRAQPDVIVQLPGERKLVVDAKVSLIAYSDYANTEDEAGRRAAAVRHTGSVREHIRGLAMRNYQRLPGLETLDFVILFVPIEPAFLLALETDSNLWLDAWQKNILLVSPSTLLFVLRTVAHLWKQEDQSRNVRQIAERGAQLYDKFAAFVEDLSCVGKELEQARGAYDAAFDKLTRGRGNLVRQAEMLRTLGVHPSKQLDRSLIQEANESDMLFDSTETNA
ncbi:MAG: recombination protein RmuC [Acidobacteriaceae bacterium]|nr:recombination protein RmuC [Acidobacteriaceae bacterium]